MATRIDLREVLSLLRDRTIAPQAALELLGEETRSQVRHESDSLQEDLARSLGQLLQIDLQDVDRLRGFGDFGMDSILGAEWIREINRRYSLGIPVAALYEHSTVEALSVFLSRELHGRPVGREFRESTDAAVPSITAPAEHRAESAQPSPVLAAPIAIIGMSGRYPMANTLDEYWHNLLQSRDCITEIPAERWDHRVHCGREKGVPGKSYCRWGGFIDGVDQFDPLFFHIAPREAHFIDPQERLFLETVWHLLEGSGYTREHLASRHRNRVGVYIGAMYQQYALLASQADGGFSNALASHGAIANRVSWFLGLEGPSIAIDTMCSSAAVAIQLACKDLARGDCSLAIAGGVNLSIHPGKYASLSRAQLIGSSLDSRSFARGDGFLPSEGVGAVLLRPLADAVADGDEILAVIKSIAASHTGGSGGYLAPNVEIAARLIEETLENAGIDAGTIGLVEAAANGSAPGDAAELAALTQAFRRYTNQTQFCAIGSAKSNIGHAESASAMAQLTKVILQLRHGQLIPSIKARPLNPDIAFEGGPFFLQQRNEAWRRPLLERHGVKEETPRRALLNSYGGGGTYVTMLLEEFVAPNQGRRGHEIADVSGPQLIVLSAASRERLKEVARRLCAYIQDHLDIELGSLAYTLQLRREPLEFRAALVVQDMQELVRRLDEYGSVEGSATLVEHPLPEASPVTALAEPDLVSAQPHFTRQSLEALARHWVAGVGIAWKTLHDGASRHLVHLPSYPFVRKRYWIDAGPRVAAVPNQALVSGVDRLRDCVARILGMTAEEIPLDRPLHILGFTSIDSLALHHLLEEATGAGISVGDLRPTHNITQLAERLEGLVRERGSAQAAGPPMVGANVNERFEPFPLTDIQESFLTGRQLTIDGERVGCHIYFETQVEALDIYRLNETWGRLIAHHELLRALILPSGQQQIMKEVPKFQIKVLDLRRLAMTERQEKLDELRSRMSHRVYDPGQWPLFDIRVTACAQNEYRIHFSIDELVCDVVGLDLLLRQWRRLYDSPQATLTQPTVSFRDYVLALKELEKSPRYKRDLAHWVRTLAGVPGGPILPGNRASRGDGSRGRRTRVTRSLAAPQWSSLKTLADAEEISPTALLLGMFCDALRLHSASSSFSLILTVFQRLPLHPELVQILGPFISTALFMSEPDTSADLRARLLEVQRRLWELLSHASVSGIRVVRELRAKAMVSPDFALPVVFTSLLAAQRSVVEHTDRSEWLDFLGTQLFGVTQTPQVHLDHQVMERDGALILSFDVAAGYFAEGVAEQLMDTYCRALAALSTRSEPWNSVGSEPTAPLRLVPPLIVDEHARHDPFPLTDQQQAYAFGSIQPAAHGGGTCRFYQEIESTWLDCPRLESSWRKVVQRHDMLRARISKAGTQEILRNVPPFELDIVDLRQVTAAEAPRELEQLRQTMVDRSNDLEAWPYFALRVSLYGESLSRIHLSVDMLVADGRSMIQLVNELILFYRNPDAELPEPTVSFRDCVMSLDAYRRTAESAPAVSYWERKLSALPPAPKLPVISRSPAVVHPSHLRLEAELAEWPALVAAAGERHLSPSMVLLTAYLNVLSAWADDPLLSVVVPSWTRLPLHADVEHVVGDFTALSWIALLDPTLPFEELARRNEKTHRQDMAHQVVSGLTVLRRLTYGRSHQMPVFPVVYTDLLPPFRVDNGHFKMGMAASKTAHVCLDNICSERGARLRVCWDVKQGVYPPGLIDEMFAGYTRLLNSLAAQPAAWQRREFADVIQARRGKTPLGERDETHA
jgi:3-oxoacyl-(acyl-carrier-protein) synthase/non-ribosomal peptide synthetase component F/acyl carrier protein